MKTELRKTGIEIMGDVPWGTHLCEFYRNKGDLIDILVPYFKAGLENNEFCMWITSEPLDTKDAFEAMRRELPDFDKYYNHGQIEILPYSEWYLKDGVFDGQRVFNGWVTKLKQALEAGYDGLRATGNTSWLEQKVWEGFNAYENGLNLSINQFKIIALCLYSTEKCSASEILDVVSNHPIAIIKQENGWKVIESSEKKRLEGMLRKTNEELEIRIRERTEELLTANELLMEEIACRKEMEEEKLLYERKLLQAQKMEAIGKLTGGIAHDFNNILTAIVGYGTLLMMKRREDSLTRDYAEHILSLSEKAANLTKGLLAFSRQQVLNMRTVNLNELVKGIDRLISRLIRENIVFKTYFPGNHLKVLADAGQIEQVLMNLLVNAIDAMPDGGSLTVSIEPATFNEEFVRVHGYGAPGEYACLSVADTGTGMDEETKKKIFEPFFTTKEVGKGTGLGLAIVYGIIQQHNGYINVYSEHGLGTIFKIYLPIAKSETGKTESDFDDEIHRGTETILVADDDMEVTAITNTIFLDAGYKVILANDGQSAVDKFKENLDNIQLILLDIIMPKKNGREVYEEIKKVQPSVKAVFTSGYTEDIINQKMVIEEGLNFIMKPIMPTELLKKVREVLDS